MACCVRTDNWVGRDFKKKIENLEDAANRNGIQEGEGFEQLKRVLIAVIQEFEADRQFIGRKLAQYKKEQDELQEQIENMRKLAEERKRWEAEKKQEEQVELEKRKKFGGERARSSFEKSIRGSCD